MRAVKRWIYVTSLAVITGMNASIDGREGWGLAVGSGSGLKAALLVAHSGEVAQIHQ